MDTWPQDQNYLPIFSPPIPFTEKQEQAHHSLHKYLEESPTPEALHNFQLYIDMQVQPVPMADMWTIGDDWPQFASITAPNMPVQYRSVYNVRTSEVEQDGSLKFVAYIGDNCTLYHLGIIKRQHVEQVSMNLQL